jgi:hypothetical protein
MTYMLLIVEPPELRARSEADRRQLCALMESFADGLRERKVLLATDSLRTEAARVVARNGKATVIDGPFAEAKEMIGGYFLLDCADRSEAIAIARDCPALDWGTVEVREIGPCYL